MPRRDDDRRRRSRSRSRSPRRRRSRSRSRSRRRSRSRSPVRRRHSPDRHRRDEPRRSRDGDRGREERRASNRERDWEEQRHSDRHREGAGYADRRDQRSPVPEEFRAEAPTPGVICRGSVHTIKPFGVFVGLEGFERHGLVHHTQVSEDLSLGRDEDDGDKVAALEYFCPRGARVWVKVLDVQRGSDGSARVSCSLRAVDQESGADLDPSGSLEPRGRAGGGGGGGPLSSEPPELDSIHRATVVSLRPFGAFVRLEGFRNGGLVHVSQISDHMADTREASDQERVAAIAGVLTVGEAVWVKVIEIKPAEPGDDRGPKLGCSIKLVSQRDGSDLDPNGLKFRPRGADFGAAGGGGGGGGGFGQRRTVGADAGQAQGGVIDWGHLDAEKAQLAPNYGAGYALVGEEAGEPQASGGGQQQQQQQRLPEPPAQAQQGQGTGVVAPSVGSVEEALAILRAHELLGGKRDRKDRSSKKGKKEKKDKKAKDRKRKKEAKESKKARKQASASSSSDSD